MGYPVQAPTQLAVPSPGLHSCSAADPQYAWVARGVLDYMIRDMTHPEGGIFSAEVPVLPRCAGCADGLQHVIQAVRIIGLCGCEQCHRQCTARSAGCRQPGSSNQLQEGGRLLPVV